MKKIRGSAIKSSFIHNTSKVEAGSHLVNVKMGKYSFCGYDCEIYNTIIGNFTSIANNVYIGLGEHPISWVSTSPVFYSGRDSVKKKFSEFDREKNKITYIGHDVWIGQNVMIKQGVRIGNGAIIGMGSVVTKDIPPYHIYAGNPAKLIRKRFPDDIIKILENSKWWELEDIYIEKCAHYIKEPIKFIYCLNQLLGEK